MEPVVKDFIDFMALLMASIWVVVALKFKIIKRGRIALLTALVIIYPARALVLYLCT